MNQGQCWGYGTVSVLLVAERKLIKQLRIDMESTSCYRQIVLMFIQQAYERKISILAIIFYASIPRVAFH